MGIFLGLEERACREVKLQDANQRRDDSRVRQGKVRGSESQTQMEDADGRCRWRPTSLGQQEECLHHGDGTAQEESF